MIPDGWTLVRLGDLGLFSKGKGIKKDDVVSDGLPCVRYGQLYTDHDSWIRGFTAFINRETALESRRLASGELLFTGSGETADEIGKCVAFLGVEEAYAGGDIVILTPKNVDSKFMGYALNAPDVVQQKIQRAQGDAVVHISASSLASLQVNLPPLEEQQAIAEALSDADALVESLDALIAKKRDMKQAAMQQLLTGRTRLPGFFEDWQERCLGDYGSTFGGLTGKSAKDFGTGEASFVTFMNVISNVLLEEDGTELVDVKAGEAQAQLRPGDLIFNGSSETPEEVGFAAVVPRELDGVYLNSFCFGFRCTPDAELDPKFFAYLTRSATGRDVIRPMAQGSTRYNLAKTNLLNGRFLLPSKNEQHAIAEVLADMDAEIDALVAQREKADLVKQGMMQELLSGRVRLV
jgi:type I restriction enzyme S subunit